MRRLLADFVLESDLCLPKESAPIAVHDRQGNWTLTLSNLEAAPGAMSARLAARLTFDHAAEMDTAKNSANEKLASALNALVYATNRRFAFVELKRIVDLTPGKVQREALIFHTSPADDRMEPSLTSEYADSATRLLAMQSTRAPHATAMRWFRLGISESDHEQQFNYFWFALEIVAQALKTTEKRNSRCPRCQGPLYCEACKTHPMHRPYPGQAIRDLVERVDPDHGSEVFETLQKVRHTLLHGDRIESIAAELPCNPQQAVDTLARVTWWAIWLMFDKPDPVQDRGLTFGYPDTVVRASLIASVHLQTTLLPGADINHPRLEDFPMPTLTMEYMEREREKPSDPQPGLTRPL